jgi:hypothetical protein
VRSSLEFLKCTMDKNSPYFLFHAYFSIRAKTERCLKMTFYMSLNGDTKKRRVLGMLVIQ